METQVNNIPLPAPGPPPPPPPPGCAGGVQLPYWRGEPQTHLAPSKEEIEKEQYANLPDKLITALNKDKKPFTYTPQGVSGIEKGKLDLTEIRSPKMKKRLMANLVVDEDEDSSSDYDRSRSETPDLLTKPKSASRRAITPDVIALNRQTYVPVLPVLPVALPVKEPVFPHDRHSPVIYRNSPQPQELSEQQPKQPQQQQTGATMSQPAQQPQQQQPQPPPIPPKPVLTPQDFDSLMYKQLEGLKNSHKHSETNNIESKAEIAAPENVSFLYPSRSDGESRSETSADEAADESVIIDEQQQNGDENSLQQTNAQPENGYMAENTMTIDYEAEGRESIPENNTSKLENNNNGKNETIVPPIPPPLPPTTYKQPSPPPPPVPPKLYQQPQVISNGQPPTMQRPIPQPQTQPILQPLNGQYRDTHLTNGNNINEKNANKVSYDSNGNNIRQPSPWESEVLRHVLDGGLQEELEKFEQISLEAENPSRTATPLLYSTNIYGEPQLATTMQETYERTEIVTNEIETKPIKFKDARELFKRIQETESAAESSSFNAFRRTRSPQPQSQPRPETPTRQSMWGTSETWGGYQTAPPPPPPSRQPTAAYPTYQTQTPPTPSNSVSVGGVSVNSRADYSSPANESFYGGGNIPSKSFQYNKQKTGSTDAEVQNYNSRPKPFYLSSPSPTPPPQQSNRPHFSTFGVNVPPSKIDYLETETTEAPPVPQRNSYIESSKMFSQTTYADHWPESGVDYSPSPTSSCSEYEPTYNTPSAAAARRKRLPPSERPPDPTPPKYQGSSIPSRSFRFLQLITGEDIENQYQNNQNPAPMSSFKPNKPLNIPNPLNPTSVKTTPAPTRTYGTNFDESGTDF